jgi:hypothetical protein
LKQIDTK